MSHFSNTYFRDLDLVINEIKRNSRTSIIASHKIIEVLNDKIYELYVWLSNYHFPTPDQEILFFKEQKPLVIAKLIHYKKIIDIESNLPIAKESKTKYLRRELDKIENYEDENSFFIQYYRSGATHNDQKYFTRTRDKNLNYYECHIINYDIRVSTSHDFNVAQILANESIVLYIEDKLENLQNNSKTNQIASPITWTGNRIDLIELLYALQAQKVLNNGSLEMKELANAFGQIFNVALDESIYRSYYDIKNRKSIRTKFLNNLAENFNNKMDEEDI